MLLIYTVFLARTLQPDSVKQYLNIIRILHLEAGLDNPLEKCYALQMLLRGIRRAKSVTPIRKLPVTPTILIHMREFIDITTSFQCTFWAACLTAFFTFCRKSTLLVGLSERRILSKAMFSRPPFGLKIFRLLLPALRIGSTKSVFPNHQKIRMFFSFLFSN